MITGITNPPQWEETATPGTYNVANAVPRTKRTGINAGRVAVICISFAGSVVRSSRASWTCVRHVAKTTITIGMYPRKHFYRNCGAKCPS